MAYKPVFAFNYTDPQYDFDGEVVKAVMNCDIYVDKEELLKALEYDRGQYQQGYADGYRQALDDIKRLMQLYNVEFRPLEQLYGKGEG